MALALRPTTPRTPYDIFASMAISSALPGVSSTPVPSISLFPPTPDDAGFTTAPSTPPAPPPPVTHRGLTNTEARQLSLLLTQHLWPVRGSPKALMRESIALSEELHEAGIRWDRHRRVMGTHLRGIWDEGQRLGTARTVGGHSPMDLYVQGSFLSILEEPHPLDPMPIAIELQPAAYAALPKFTLNSGLANAMPGTLPSFISYPVEPELLPQTAMTLPVANRFAPKKGRWRDKKKLGLHVRTEGHIKSGLKAVPGPHSAVLASARLISGTGVGRWPKMKSSLALGKLGSLRLWRVTTKRTRQINLGGWEVR